MFDKKGPILHGVRCFVAMLSCVTLVTAQSPTSDGVTPVPDVTQNSCTLKDPGPRPAGNSPLYTITDEDGNVVPDFAQQSQNGKNNSSGNHLPSLTNDEVTFWTTGLVLFGDLVSVQGDKFFQTEPIAGLGPRFNGNSCFMCHSQPAIGGTSPGPGTPLTPSGGTFTQNPEITVATLDGAGNSVPTFVKPDRTNGPTVEARFPRNADANGVPVNTPDGAVHELFTIAGRSDAPSNCTINQPKFAAAITNNNIIFRIPTPTFGVGFMETISDDLLTANFASNASLKSSLGINSNANTGFNRSGNDQTITRFGWKAQNPSLLVFAGEANNVEIGVTNEAFLFEKDKAENDGTGCATNATPEDEDLPSANMPAPGLGVNNHPLILDSFTDAERYFMLTNTPPAECDFASGSSLVPNGNGNSTQSVPNCKPLSTSALNGQTQFNNVGCNLCHTTSLTTGPSPLTDLNNATFHPFSDFALHHMGATLTDGVSQGAAGPDQFRTAPLWGAGQRLFFLHDGRATTVTPAPVSQAQPGLPFAIQQHGTSSSKCTSITTEAQTFILNGQTITIPAVTTQFCGSEANGVINKFNALSCTDQQDIINFLRSL
jgi:CxxC motif-containing protein (DUF1111 family)